MNRRVGRVPDASSARALLWRGVLAWMLVRGVITTFVVLLQRDAQPEILLLSPSATAGVVLLATAVGWIETRRNHELYFLANLGITGPVIVALLALPPLLGELAIAAGVR